ncbi:glycosyltransferase [Desulfofundulus thermocisternus]|uniref:glycosyltransferase n=1 Tax=Desulfofundulus thermocisternus TaxID=42471 RepID=UPI00068B4D89|nr:glycosyltransferase [Desulfofundulus thermocisternus]
MTIKSILIVTEAFEFGGLETHIRGEIKELSKYGCRVHLACGHRFREDLIPSSIASVSSGLALGPDATMKDLVNTVEALDSLIVEHNVQVVHAHPFTSMFPALIASEKRQLPCVLSLHGPASLGDCYGPYYDFLLRSVILPGASMVIAVSEEVLSLVLPYVSANKVVLIPNAVALNDYPVCEFRSPFDAPWLVVSRLDAFKVKGIIEFIRYARKAGIKGIKIAGDGPARTSLEDMLRNEGLQNYVNFLGFRTDITNLMHDCSGVAGMGRVVLESLACGKPVCLVGYDGVKGLVDKQLFDRAAKFNFSGRNLPNIDVETFMAQLACISKNSVIAGRDWLIPDHDEGFVWQKFLSFCNSAPVCKPSIATNIYTWIVSNCEVDQFPYLLSDNLFKQTGKLIHSRMHSNHKIVSSFHFYQLLHEEHKLQMMNKLFAERDMQIASLKQAIAERENDIVRLKHMIAERDGQIAIVKKAVIERDEQIASLNQTLAEREAQIASLKMQLHDIWTSNSWRITRPLRFFKKLVRNSKRTIYLLLIRIYSRLPKAFHYAKRIIYKGSDLAFAFARVLRTHGVRYALTKVKQRLLRELSQPTEIGQVLATNQERYLMEQSAQSSYLKRYIESGFISHHFDYFHEHLATRIMLSTKVLVYPLSYPRELTQRPDHVIRYFAQNGYLCIIISIDNKDPFVQEISSGIYFTNMFAETISYLSGRKPVLYITYPFFSYIVEHLPNAVVVYDTLDDLSVFSLYCDAMKRDHESLLARSDVALFSSKALLDKNRSYVVNDSFLVSNGVWVDDFKLDPMDPEVPVFQKPEGAVLIGYHGAISELLDWELLERILQDRRIWLVFIGPLTRFDELSSEVNVDAQQRVLSSDRVIHIPTVPYSELKYYLRLFDAGIIPFIVNDKTNSVLPLKLFEYMAMGLKVFATSTRTLSEYAEFITVADRTMLPTAISKWVDDMHDGGQKINSTQNYDPILREVDWGSQLAPVLKKVDELLNDHRPRRRQARRVDIVNINFFDWDGITLYKGGAERYIFDLACLLKEMGWSPRIIQNANNPFEIDFRGIPVYGVQTGCGHDLRGMSRKYREVCRNTDLIIASPLDLACELGGLNVIGINHGIYWDHKYKTLSDFNLTEYRNVFDALRVVRTCVCVDTNFINWVRTYDYTLSEKLRYVPNYFDGGLFKPVDKDFTGKIRFLYPRRLYEARGIFITLKAFDYLFDKYKDIELHLVGQANLEDARIVSEFVAKYSGRVIWEEFDMDEMHKVYQKSHVVLIPTMYSEGTSLSCLEAMATRNAVIATNIGGLPNLVIDGFNGRLIEPKVESLVEAIETLLSDRRQIAEMAEKGVQLANVFEKERWIRHWRNIIQTLVEYNI